jgi:hypothetical protein
MQKSQVVVSFGKPDQDSIKIQKAAEFCRDHIRRSAMAILDCGRELALLKAAFREDEQRWLAAFGEGPGRAKVGKNPFPFTSRTADMLIRSHARLSGNAVSTTNLPASWGTLYELSKLTDKQLEAAKEKIHPMMTRSEASALRPKKKSTKPATPTNQKIERAHETYMRIDDRDQFLREIVAMVRDRKLTIEDVCRAWKAFQ